MGTIFPIEKDFSWYYFMCMKCKNTAFIVPKFVIEVQAYCLSHGFNCSTKLMLFESDAKKIVSCSAYDLLNGEYDEFVVLIEKDNINDGNDTYKVAYAWVSREPLQSDTIGDSNVLDDLQTIVLVDQRVESLATHSITTSSKRKDKEDDPLESQSSSSKKLCIPSIGDNIVKGSVGIVEEDLVSK
uniref:Uncharacterized protein F21N10.10 n=1 Tax=Arabidopsis thaliana TaxID=3702 RepID=Q9FWJ3_ARATH|nr:hypothetical protein; 86715-85759 [Arabidopsis thaliana]